MPTRQEYNSISPKQVYPNEIVDTFIRDGEQYDHRCEHCIHSSTHSWEIHDRSINSATLSISFPDDFFYGTILFSDLKPVHKPSNCLESLFSYYHNDKNIFIRIIKEVTGKTIEGDPTEDIYMELIECINNKKHPMNLNPSLG